MYVRMTYFFYICVFFCDRQAKLSVRAVTREETTVAVLDSDLYDKSLARLDPKDAHAAVCREV